MKEFKVDGMTCQGCVKSVTNAIKAIDENAEVSVDLGTKIVNVLSAKTEKEIRDSIEDAGYDIIEG
jgi:copper chaperone